MQCCVTQADEPGNRTSSSSNTPATANESGSCPANPTARLGGGTCRELSAIEVRLAGHDYHGHAVTLDGREHPDDVQRGLTLYLNELPRAGKALGISADARTDQGTDLADAAKSAVIVRIDLDTSS